MQRRDTVRLLFLTLVAVGAPAAAGGSADWAFTVDKPREIRLPAAIVQAAEFGELDYEGPPYRGFRADLNGDGIPEYIVQSAPSLCGNGGCPFALFEGATLHPLGMVFGGWIVVRATRPGTLPVINALSHLSAEAASYTTFAYDAGHYVTRSSTEVRDPALEQLVQELRRVPIR